MLLSSGPITDVNIILDEAHSRQMDVECMVTLLKDVYEGHVYEGKGGRVRLMLMSATIASAPLKAYFAGDREV
ncbi:unnamed protein product [Vitrella brassicaformis CCMP3155]|uniref:Helicase ATP-binding domain-containing protein n=1 Tax=Vitrella brassicaformis (strain CCMP3155) TaxID=1169540 RepID=A0A0G4EMW7_VITBC|nr:unnamed protein product [Vitrella brassicaformis CCMP3155]|eukprot:CEL98159.1 unnamed protein product [Vitrella brassicaformis CCMP3155]